MVNEILIYKKRIFTDISHLAENNCTRRGFRGSFLWQVGPPTNFVTAFQPTMAAFG